ncbi:ABC transporter ATP-binding protein [Corynebacterium epidermidicanis]|uniref:ABC-type cobalamin/Fe3+-siderophore transport system, ATPase component n=1 Tax=Corynebacterium epidermidicanis TaxID=1050174 RepID=A0A0G3GUX3_9CORY|nr:ABC transporter ATP-binding protein [Corynebacterium epidermidicanis]AKK04320.1 ABC-type cobalamin/Fe3+-siderophore transport system, ATPase component [Corynebacterium epidermidicanis]
MISGQELRVSYGSHVVVDGVSLDLPHGETLGLVGPNGSGKTTLLRALYGSLPAQGTVLIDARSLDTMSRRDIARTVSVVVQEPDSDFSGSLSVAEVVQLGRLPHGFSAGDGELVHGALAQVGMLGASSARFADLSGGEKQRVLIARAIAQDCSHILLDEPTNHLDIRYQHEVLSLLTGVHASVAVVLHDLNLAARYCARIAVLSAGKVVAFGSPDEVLVPEVLEPVYGVRVQRFDLQGQIHLTFGLE